MLVLDQTLLHLPCPVTVSVRIADAGQPIDGSLSVVEPGFVVFLNGGYGVGKSTVLDHVGDLLAGYGRPFALMDVDWFHRAWPPAADDPTNTMVEAINMAAVWNNYRAAGRRQAIVSGVVADLDDRRRYEQAFGQRVRSVRLEASAAETSRRLQGRYWLRAAGPLEWHMNRFEELALRVRTADLDELVIYTDDNSPADSAALIVSHFGLAESGR